MTTQGILVDAVFSGLTGSTGDFVNKRLSGGRVAFHPAGGANTYKNVYTSATVGGSTLIDQSVNSGVVLNDAGSAEVYAVGHYLCKAYDSNNVLQITFELRYGDVSSDGSGGSASSTAILDIKSSYGTNAADINNAITYANANSTSEFVFLFKDANFTLENNMAFPANVTMQVEPTAKLMLYAGVNAVTINGPIKHDFNQIFKYENNTTCTVTIDPKYTEQVYPQWFGAVPDGTSDSSFFVTKALATGIKRLVLAGGNFKLNSNITIPSDVEIIRKGGSDFTLASGVTVSGLGTKATVFDKISVSTISATGNGFLGQLTGNLNGDVMGTCTNAQHISVADNESTDENNLIPFIENGSATGNVGLESDGDFYYNPSTGGLNVHNVITSVVSKTSNYTAANESIILVDASSGAVTINLPAASGLSGREYTITKTDSSSNNVLIDANASETINGSTVFYLNVQYEQVKLVCTGTSWIIAGANFDVFSTGQIIPWSGTSVPANALECNGANVNRTTYARLFEKIGTIYGVGDGSTTFGLPDYRGRFLRGFDNTAGTDPDAASRTDRGDGTTGDAIGTKQADAFQGHNHRVGQSTSSFLFRDTDNRADTGSGDSFKNSSSGLEISARTIITDGSNGTPRITSETRPKNINVMYCIKV